MLFLHLSLVWCSVQFLLVCVYVCACCQHSPYPISLVKRRDHGRRVFGHESHQQLEHVMNILILRREDSKVSKLIYTKDENKVRGTKTKLWGVDKGWGLQWSRWYFGARIDIIATERYIVFLPLLCNLSWCLSAVADSHSHSF